ncbi:MAG TPA: hypothetical protein VFI59_08310 [Actinomycetota bacterium]|nr:hypothetical protein [Actinomycetota bacterium]
MSQIEFDDAVSKRFEEVATIVAFVTVIGIAYACERAYRRWTTEINPLTAPRARVEHMRTDYRGKRETVSDVAEIIGAVFGEVGDALATRRGYLGEPA